MLTNQVQRAIPPMPEWGLASGLELLQHWPQLPTLSYDGKK